MDDDAVEAGDRVSLLTHGGTDASPRRRAQLSGRLAGGVVREGSAYLRVEWSTEDVVLIRWPLGWSYLPGSATVLNPAGNAVAAVGDLVHWGGAGPGPYRGLAIPGLPRFTMQAAAFDVRKGPAPLHSPPR